ncbi:MAG: hypothetical protein K0B10_15645 [Vicingaceae bacterium]|nr:hypothetical protein [Vicingaceae bacterium]
MIFREIKVNELVDFVNTPFYKNANIVPITPQRAVSQANNPYAQPNDVALVLALNNKEEIIGFIGILPGKTTLTDERFFWNTCWWIDPEKGKIAAMPLFYSMLKITKSNLIFFDLTPHTASIVAKMGFVTNSITGTKVFLRFNLNQILLKKYAFLKIMKPILILIDAGLNSVLAKKSAKKELTYQVVTQLDKTMEAFLNKFKPTMLTPFDNTFFTWVSNYSWLTTQPNEFETAIAKKYYFSYVTQSFNIELLKITHQNELIGIIVVACRDSEMKIPYCFFDDNATEKVLEAIFNYAYDKKITTITTFHPKIEEELKLKKNTVLFTKQLVKHVGYPKKCDALSIAKKLFQDGEGDAVFT